MPTEVLIGLFGLIIGAVLGISGDIYVNHRRMKFEAYKDVKLVLNQMHTKLVDAHSKIQQFYNDKTTDDPRMKIIELKDFHWHVMEIYKDFRIYFGDLKAYELQSAVYNYYYMYAKNNTNGMDFNESFFLAYQALKDAYGLMISEVKLGLVSVNFIAKANKKLKENKLAEYEKYSNRLYKTMDKIKLNIDDSDDHTDVSLKDAIKVVKDRIEVFEDEYKHKIKKD